MLKFNEFRTNITEATKVPAGEKEVKSFKVGGKNKYDALVTKKGSTFVAYIDGDKLDVFKSSKEAEKAIKDFTDLMGK